MLLARRSFAARATRLQQPGDPANDRQRMVARAIVHAVWWAQTQHVLRRRLQEGPGLPITVTTPCEDAYDAAEAEVVQAECALRAILDRSRG